MKCDHVEVLVHRDIVALAAIVGLTEGTGEGLAKSRGHIRGRRSDRGNWRGLHQIARSHPGSVAVGLTSAIVLDDVLAANDAFYDAHERRDLAAMGTVWEHSDRAVCIHPGWPILRGWPTVEESWRRIFVGPGRNQFIITNIVVDGSADLAWVTLDENLMQGGTTGTVAATNIFVRGDHGWKMIVHHGSAVMG